MGKKDNFGQAMYEMFGVGKDGGDIEETVAETVQEVKREAAYAPVVEKVAPAPAAPVAHHTAPAAPKKNQVTYLAEGTVMEGTLRTKSDVEICGEFKGEIVSEGKVTMHTSMEGNITTDSLVVIACTMKGDVNATGGVSVDEASFIEGNIIADSVECAGEVKGNLEVRDNLLLKESAVIRGDIKAGSMSVSRGAKIKGNISMVD